MLPAVAAVLPQAYMYDGSTLSSPRSRSAAEVLPAGSAEPAAVHAPAAVGTRAKSRAPAGVDEDGVTARAST